MNNKIYRDKNGRFVSKKEISLEQKASENIKCFILAIKTCIVIVFIAGLINLIERMF